MAEKSLLTKREKRALQVREDLPQALAVRAWQKFAEKMQVPEDAIEKGLNDIRNMSSKEQFKLPRHLASAARLAELLPIVFSLNDQAEVPETTSKMMSELQDSLGGMGATPGLVPEQSKQGDEVVDVPTLDQSDMEEAPFIELKFPDETAHQDNYDELTQELSEIPENNSLIEHSDKGMKWATDVFGSEFVGDLSVEELVQKIMALAKPPASKIGKNHRGPEVDSAQRIRSKLSGKSYREIADDEQGSSASSVQQWFSLRIIKVIKVTQSMDPSKNESSYEPEPEPEPRFERSIAEEPMHVQLAERYASVLGLDSGQKMALIGLIDPKNKGVFTNKKQEVINLIKSELSKADDLKDILEHLEPAEKYRMFHLLGVKIEYGRVVDSVSYQLTEQIQQARTNGSDIESVTKMFYSGVEKLLRLLE